MYIHVLTCIYKITCNSYDSDHLKPLRIKIIISETFAVKYESMSF